MPLTNIAHFQAHRARHGQDARWFMALPAGTDDPRAEATANAAGVIYEEQTLASDVRVLRWQAEEEMTVEEFGVINAGTTIVSVLPSEIALSKGDRLMFTEAQDRRRVELLRGDTDFDTLPTPPATSAISAPVVALLRVWQGSTTYTADTHYRLTGNTVEWLSGGPDEGEKFGVSYSFRPVFHATGRVLNQGFIDKSGELLSEWWAMEQVMPSG